MYLAEETVAYVQTKSTVTKVTEGIKIQKTKNIQTSFKNVSYVQTFSKYMHRFKETAYAERVDCSGGFKTASCLPCAAYSVFLLNSFLTLS